MKKLLSILFFLFLITKVNGKIFDPNSFKSQIVINETAYRYGYYNIWNHSYDTITLEIRDINHNIINFIVIQPWSNRGYAISGTPYTLEFDSPLSHGYISNGYSAYGSHVIFNAVGSSGSIEIY